MRILIPTADYPPIEGGIATLTLNLARELAALGHEVTVVAPYFREQEGFDEDEPVRVVRYRGYGLGWLRFLPMLAATLRHIRSCDVVMGINIAYGGVIGMVAGALFRKPYVTFAYAYEFLKFGPKGPGAALLRAAYRHSTLAVAISRFSRDRLEAFGVAKSRIETLLPGATLRCTVTPEQIVKTKQKYVLNGHPIILAVGRMIPRKGHVTLVEALPRILQAHPETALLCVGRGPCLSAVSRRAHELGVREHVRLPGRLPVEDVEALYEACDVFALPTGHDAGGQVEGFGLVFSEAHAHGKPVVAGRSGGVEDAVLHGETGLLVEPGDADGLADAIVSLLDDPEKARGLGERGRERVERELNWEHFTGRLMEAFEARR